MCPIQGLGELIWEIHPVLYTAIGLLFYRMLTTAPVQRGSKTTRCDQFEHVVTTTDNYIGTLNSTFGNMFTWSLES